MEILFSEEFIRLNYPAVDKKSLLQEMTSVLDEQNVISSIDDFFAEIWKRETIMSTGIGRGIAIPHSSHESANELVICVYQLSKAIDFDSIDEKPVAIIFLIAVPRSQQNHYMKILSAISNFVRQPGNVDKLRQVSTIAEMMLLLKQIKIKN
jgi:fructose-specific phosphotransferase system IIA component